jgi:hypothetical protein
LAIEEVRILSPLCQKHKRFACLYQTETTDGNAFVDSSKKTTFDGDYIKYFAISKIAKFPDLCEMAANSGDIYVASFYMICI